MPLIIIKYCKFGKFRKTFQIFIISEVLNSCAVLVLIVIYFISENFFFFAR